jgi:hypothetical protein
MTDRTCDKCQHFTADRVFTDTGECALMGDINSYTHDYRYTFAEGALGINPTKAYGADYEGYAASVVVGPKFGCIHWTKNEAAHGIKETTK